MAHVPFTPCPGTRIKNSITFPPSVIFKRVCVDLYSRAACDRLQDPTSFTTHQTSRSFPEAEAAEDLRSAPWSQTELNDHSVTTSTSCTLAAHGTCPLVLDACSYVTGFKGTVWAFSSVSQSPASSASLRILAWNTICWRSFQFKQNRWLLGL